jgi:hypothetical protein
LLLGSFTAPPSNKSLLASKKEKRMSSWANFFTKPKQFPGSYLQESPPRGCPSQLRRNNLCLQEGGEGRSQSFFISARDAIEKAA